MRQLHTENIVIQSGRLGEAPDFKKIERDGKDAFTVSNFSLRVETLRRTEASRDSDEPEYEVADGHWLRCSAFGKAAEDAKRLKKGQAVLVFAAITEAADWTDKDGNLQRNQLQARVERIFLDPRDLADFQLRERRGLGQQERAGEGVPA